MNIVIIGASAAGLSCLNTLCTISLQANITVISAERYPPYRRCFLPYYLSNSMTEQELTISSPSDYPSNVHFILGQKAEKIDVQKKTVRISDGRELGYDKLLIAVGADAVQPKYYAEGRRTFTLRNLDDAKKIIDAAKGRAVVLGGGFVGIQTVCALLERNIKTHMVITSRHLLAMFLDKASARYIEKDLVDMGIEITTRDNVADITWHKNQLKVFLSSGIALETDVVVVCKGFKPSVDLAKASGIKVNEGISVNEYLETSAPDIFAAGDCCETIDLAWNKVRTIDLWPAAVEQGRFAALNMSGTRSRYPGSIRMNSLQTKAFHLISAGVLKGEPGLTIYEKYMPSRNQFRKFALRGNVPVGMAFYNCPEEAGLFVNVIKKAMPLTVNPENIVNGDVSIHDLMKP
ncbi:MAG TPA: FAD-dependent oxidoreductase [Syntrophales bacterium]|nr:FAD-dependent oxidoreductase [Syntrophales bacterium]